MNLTDERLIRALRKPYDIRDGRIIALDPLSAQTLEEEAGGINAIKTFLKRWSGLYEFLRAFFSPGLSIIPHLTPAGAVRQAFSAEARPNKFMLNIGSGVKHVDDNVFNVDVYPYEQVQIVADGAHLPFKDGTVDLILCESVLEHVREPYQVIAEIRRVLKPGGYAYISVPFLYPFHASPNDFTRFSRNSLRALFSPYAILQEGMRAGPMAALQGVLMHLFALVLSFGSYTVYLVLSNIFMVVFAPLKLLDPFFALFPYSHEIAADIYIFVRKE